MKGHWTRLNSKGRRTAFSTLAVYSLLIISFVLNIHQFITTILLNPLQCPPSFLFSILIRDMFLAFLKFGCLFHRKAFSSYKPASQKIWVFFPHECCSNQPILDQHHEKDSSFLRKSHFHLNLFNSILSLNVKYFNYRIVFYLTLKAEHLAGWAYTAHRIILN